MKIMSLSRRSKSKKHGMEAATWKQHGGIAAVFVKCGGWRACREDASSGARSLEMPAIIMARRGEGGRIKTANRLLAARAPHRRGGDGMAASWRSCVAKERRGGDGEGEIIIRPGEGQLLICSSAEMEVTSCMSLFASLARGSARAARYGNTII